MSRPGSIGVVIPVFNAVSYVADALGSVLAQTRPCDQVVVVDDGSTDGSAEAVRELGGEVEYIYQDNAGIGAARNAGLRRVSCDYVAFHDADDLWAPRKLELQASVLDRNSGVDLVFGLVDHFLSPELDATTAARLACPDQPMAGLGAPVMLARREAFASVGGFSEEVTLGEFVDWFARAREAGLETQSVPEVVYHRRVHAGNAGVREVHARHDYVRVMKAMLDRRRGSEPLQVPPADA